MLIRVVEHMQKQDEVIASLRRKLQECGGGASESRPPDHAMADNALVAEPVSTPTTMREAALAEQLAGAQKALNAMQSSQGELKAELERFKTRQLPTTKSAANDRGSPTSMKPDAPRRLSEKKVAPLALGAPTILPKPRSINDSDDTSGVRAFSARNCSADALPVAKIDLCGSTRVAHRACPCSRV